MQRVLVVGCGGAGKSTVARQLSHATGLPLVGLDRAYWRPGWIEPSTAEWRATVVKLAAEPAWVMDGNYSATFDLRMPRADTLVWLDYPRAACLRRVLLRTLKNYGRNRPDMTDGCPERFDAAFLRIIWEFPVKSRPRIVAALECFGSHLRVVQLTEDPAVAAFVQAQGLA
jgi:adenylate kinase family enzyme